MVGNVGSIVSRFEKTTHTPLRKKGDNKIDNNRFHPSNFRPRRRRVIEEDNDSAVVERRKEASVLVNYDNNVGKLNYSFSSDTTTIVTTTTEEDDEQDYCAITATKEREVPTASVSCESYNSQCSGSSSSSATSTITTNTASSTTVSSNGGGCTQEQEKGEDPFNNSQCSVSSSSLSSSSAASTITTNTTSSTTVSSNGGGRTQEKEKGEDLFNNCQRSVSSSSSATSTITTNTTSSTTVSSNGGGCTQEQQKDTFIPILKSQLNCQQQQYPRRMTIENKARSTTQEEEGNEQVRPFTETSDEKEKPIHSNVRTSVAWEKPSWVMNHSNLLRSTQQGMVIRKRGCLQAPITHVKKPSKADMNLEAPNPKKLLRSSNYGNKLRLGNVLVEPISPPTSKTNQVFAEHSLVEDTTNPNHQTNDRASLPAEAITILGRSRSNIVRSLSTCSLSSHTSASTTSTISVVEEGIDENWLQTAVPSQSSLFYNEEAGISSDNDDDDSGNNSEDDDDSGNNSEDDVDNHRQPHYASIKRLQSPYGCKDNNSSSDDDNSDESLSSLSSSSSSSNCSYVFQSKFVHKSQQVLNRLGQALRDRQWQEEPRNTMIFSKPQEKCSRGLVQESSDLLNNTSLIAKEEKGEKHTVILRDQDDNNNSDSSEETCMSEDEEKDLSLSQSSDTDAIPPIQQGVHSGTPCYVHSNNGGRLCDREEEGKTHKCGSEAQPSDDENICTDESSASVSSASVSSELSSSSDLSSMVKSRIKKNDVGPPSASTAVEVRDYNSDLEGSDDEPLYCSNRNKLCPRTEAMSHKDDKSLNAVTTGAVVLKNGEKEEESTGEGRSPQAKKKVAKSVTVVPQIIQTTTTIPATVETPKLELKIEEKKDCSIAQAQYQPPQHHNDDFNGADNDVIQIDGAACYRKHSIALETKERERRCPSVTFDKREDSVFEYLSSSSSLPSNGTRRSSTTSQPASILKTSSRRIQHQSPTGNRTPRRKQERSSVSSVDTAPRRPRRRRSKTKNSSHLPSLRPEGRRFVDN